ncbi:pentatricopeptide repeat-containing protein At4g33170-like [Musa acuminata AAA Group]|uniref:pentatricopeptide repeat-containing protein At4g33170-like n=1 Tax=Musa acuminata AAA Group TaxID=214697 RepID=UPI0031CE6396
MPRCTLPPLMFSRPPIYAYPPCWFRTSRLSPDHEEEDECYAHLLQRCAQTSDLRLGTAIHSQLLKRPFLHSSLFLQNHLLNMYFKCCREPSLPLHLFDQMPLRNVVTWSAAIAGLVQCGRPFQALSLFYDMHREGVRPNEFALVSALNAASLSDGCSQARQIYSQVIRLGFDSNVFLINAFLMSLIRNGRIEEAAEVFDKYGDKDVVSWNSMLAGYLQCSYSDLWRFWCRMSRAGLRPDEFSFSSVLTGLAKASCLRSGVQVHGQVVRHGHGEDVCVGNSLVEMYLKNKDLVSSSKAFAEMPWSDVVSWTQMAAGALDCGQPAEALRIVDQMKLAGVRPNKFTLATMFNAYSSLTSLEEGRKAHGYRIKLGDEVDECVDNALVDMYAKCGSTSSALQVFRSMKQRSVISWTAMIMGLAQNGRGREAAEAYDEMIAEKVRPNYITLICVLYACGQGRLVEKGRRYFDSMERDHGIVPGEDHYACMVDLLGKAGCIAEAEELIRSMISKPGVLVWQTLLGACQLHGDVETGKRAAEQALAMEEKDPSTYVLLSNMFADAKNWAVAGRIRELMEEREVRKMPGSSWTGA